MQQIIHPSPDPPCSFLLYLNPEVRNLNSLVLIPFVSRARHKRALCQEKLRATRAAFPPHPPRCSLRRQISTERGAIGNVAAAGY